MRNIKCVVAATNSEGYPDFFPVVVHCLQTQYDDGAHYDAAKAKAEEEDYSAYLTYDENDGPAFLFDQFDWKRAHTTKVE